jgi:predicted HTH transcriptional regulator
VEEQLNKRQKEMVGLLVRGESLTSRRCQKLFGVTGPTVASDCALLVELGLAQQQGKGRSTRYVLAINPNR